MSQSKVQTKLSPDRLYRSETDRVIAGVAGGLAEYFSVDAALVRLAFLVLIFTAFSGPLLYLLMWIVIPTESMVKTKKQVKTGTETKGKAKEVDSEVLTQEPPKSSQQRHLFAKAFIIFGIILLLYNFGWLDWIEAGKLWPVVLIVIGLYWLKD